MFKKYYLLKKDSAKKQQTKAQAVITDLFIALFIATILVILIIFVWNKYLVLADDEVSYNDLQIAALQAANILVKSQGDPVNWEETPSEVNIIGLASSDRNLSTQKVNAYINLYYNISSTALGVELYDFYFQLKDIDGTQLAEHGKSPDNNVVNVVNIQRFVLYENEKAIVEFALWK